jgi:hypothetical protein
VLDETISSGSRGYGAEVQAPPPLAIFFRPYRAGKGGLCIVMARGRHGKVASSAGAANVLWRSPGFLRSEEKWLVARGWMLVKQAGAKDYCGSDSNLTEVSTWTRSIIDTSPPIELLDRVAYIRY